MPAGEEFSRQVTESQQRLYAHIYSLLGNTASSWDVLQETNIVLWAKRDEFEPGSNFRAWSHTVARFQVMAYLRDRTTRRDTTELFCETEAVARTVAKNAPFCRTWVEICRTLSLSENAPHTR